MEIKRCSVFQGSIADLVVVQLMNLIKSLPCSGLDGPVYFLFQHFVRKS